MDIRNLNQYSVGSIILITSLLIAGAALIALGAILQKSGQTDTLASVFTAFGGTLFGVVSTLLLGYLKQFDLLEILKQSLEAKFISEEEKIAPLKRKFHKYHLTETEEGWSWKYAVYDFSNCLTAGSLDTATVEEDDSGNPYPGKVYAGIREDRLIFFTKYSSGEQINLDIFPYFGKGITRKYAGIRIFETWLLNPTISKIILTLEPILDYQKTGKVPKDVEVECEKIWKQLLLDKNNLNPLIQSLESLNKNKS